VDKIIAKDHSIWTVTPGLGSAVLTEVGVRGNRQPHPLLYQSRYGSDKVRADIIDKSRKFGAEEPASAVPPDSTLI
jgi:hypothetical protein